MPGILLLDIPASQLFREEADLGRSEGKEEKCQRHEDGQDSDQQPEFPCPGGSAKFPCGAETDEDGDKKDSNINESHILSKYAGIGVKKNRNAPCAQQPSRQEGGAQGRIAFADAGRQKETPKQDREEDQLHVFPGGFINWGEEGDYRISSGPLIEKMGQSPKDRCEENARDKIRFDRFCIFIIHIKIPHIPYMQKKNFCI